jgi:hypothetical protein
MPRRRESIAPITDMEVARRQIRALQNQVKSLRQAGTTTMQIIDLKRRPRVEGHLRYIDPIEGEVVWSMQTQRGYVFHDEQWYPISPPEYHIKVDADDQIVITEDRRFVFLITEDMDGLELAQIEIYVTTVGGQVIVQIRNEMTSNDLLSTRATIDAGEKNSKTAAVQPVINPANAVVSWGDHLSIDVDDGGSTMGLGVCLTFN